MNNYIVKYSVNGVWHTYPVLVEAADMYQAHNQTKEALEKMLGITVGIATFPSM